jgi:phosphate transport system substrate-binding protein
MVKRIALIALIAAALVPVSTVVPSATSAAPEDTTLAIIVNKTNPVDNLSLNDLRKIFTSEQETWSNGRKIQVVMREPGQAERDLILRLVCKMNENDYSRSAVQSSFNGDSATPPKLFPTSAGVRRFVSNLPGAIGYMAAKEQDDSVKIIKVEGLLPDQPGYKLK